MIDPDDERHGTVSGHIAHQRDGNGYCGPCIRAKAMYDKRRVWDAANGRAYTVSSLGARRRVQALQAVGWGRQPIAEAAGWKTSGALRYIDRSDTITRTTHLRIAAVYERLAMQPPPDEMAARRTRTWAKRHGHAPPLAYTDIDDPSEEPQGVGHRPRYLNDITIATEYDEAVVLRILGGDFRVPATHAERCAVVARWPGSHNELERRTSWRIARYVTRAPSSPAWGQHIPYVRAALCPEEEAAA